MRSLWFTVFFAVTIVLSAAACQTDTNGTPAEDCHTLSVDACEQETNCRTVQAQASVPTESCWDKREPVACVAADQACDQRLVTANGVAPFEGNWKVPEDCLPEGWDVFDVDGTMPEWPDCDNFPNCEALDADACEQEVVCAPLRATRANVSASCLMQDEEIVGCAAYDIACDDALGVGRDPDDGLWLFHNLCFPQGWEHDREQGDILSWDTCSEDQTVDCEALDADACEQETACAPLKATRANMSASCLMQDQEIVGCAAHDIACNDALGIGRDPDDGLWFFHNLCFPQGWEHDRDHEDILSWDTCSEDQTVDCNSLSVEACRDHSADGCGVLSGQHLDTDQKCIDSIDEVGCSSVRTPCAGAITLAQSPDGEMYKFNSTCIPSGWQTTPYNGMEQWDMCELTP